MPTCTLKLSADERNVLVRHIIRHKSLFPEQHAQLAPFLVEEQVVHLLEGAASVELMEVQAHALKALVAHLLVEPNGPLPNKRRQLGHLYYHVIAKTLGGGELHIALDEDQEMTVELALLREDAIQSRRETYHSIGDRYSETREWSYNGIAVYPGDLIPLDDLRIIQDALREDPASDAQVLSTVLESIIQLPELPPRADTTTSWRLTQDNTVN